MSLAVVFIIAFIAAFTFSLLLVLGRKANEILVNASEYAVPKKGVEFCREFNLVAHRGLSSVAPENTISAFRLAGEAGFKYIECDIHLTKDKKWVIMHDPTVDRMTNGTGAIKDKTFDEIRALRINRGSGIERYRDEKVPSLEEYLEICMEYEAIPVIEVKLAGEFDYQSFIDVLKAYGMTDKAIAIDYSVPQLTELRKICPELKMQILCKYLWKKTVNQAKKLGNCGVDVMFNLMHRNKMCGEVIKNGMDFNSWTIDSEKALKRIKKYGASFATTNTLMPMADKTESVQKV